MDPILICTQRLAGTTAVPEVRYNVDVATTTPHDKPEAAPEVRSASTKPEHDAEVLVAKSKLLILNVPVAYPDGNVTLIP